MSANTGRSQGEENKGEHKRKKKKNKRKKKNLRKPTSVTAKVVADAPAEVSVHSCRHQAAKCHVAFELKAQVTGRTWACRAKRLAGPNPGYRSHSLASGSRDRIECC